MSYWEKAFGFTEMIIGEAYRQGVQGAEIRNGQTQGHDAMILDDYKVVGGNVLLQVNVTDSDMPYFADYYELAAVLPRLTPLHYPFPHPDFEVDGFKIRPVIDVDALKKRAILLISRY